MEGCPDDSQIIKAFRKYSEDLRTKHDKYERIVKISRDITIESKRLIFTIHNLPMDKTADVEALEKIRDRFKKIVECHFRKIAAELENEDQHLYHRAYTWGVQEYIEALTYFNYITTGELVGWEKVAENCSFKFQGSQDEAGLCEDRQVQLLVPLSDYILGIQDMTGEMMRLCITSLGKGDNQGAQTACNFVKYVYAALHMLHACNNEFYKKLEVTGQSLRKMEYGCYLAKIQSLEFKSQKETNSRIIIV